MRITATPLFLFITLLGLALAVQAQRAGESVVVEEAVNDDFYAAGRVVRILAAIGGDAVIAGETLSITAPVRGDVLAAGRDLTVDAELGDDLRAAGETVTLQGRVNGHIAAAGRVLLLAAGSSVGDKAWLAGDTIRVLGDVGGPLRAAGRRLEIRGSVDGDVTFYGSELFVADSARITGNVTARSEVEPSIGDGAEIGGQLHYEPLQVEDEGPGGLGFMNLLGIAVAAVLLFLLWPRLMERVAATARRAPGMHLLAGLAVLLVTPIFALLLLITAIGGFLAFGLLALYLALILFGFVAGLFNLSTGLMSLLRRSPPASRTLPVLVIGVAALLVWLLGFVPLLGGVLFLALLLSGMGALSMLAFGTWRRELD